jgi:hypothetical protein
MNVCSLGRVSFTRPIVRERAVAKGRQLRRCRVANGLRPRPRPQLGRAGPLRAAVDSKAITSTGKPAGEWFFTESGQKGWVRASHLPSLSPALRPRTARVPSGGGYGVGHVDARHARAPEGDGHIVSASSLSPARPVTTQHICLTGVSVAF